MSKWGRSTYGEPCEECGFSWDVDTSDAKALVAGIPALLTEMLTDARGDERHPAVTWSVSSYVAHVGDNLRIWAERLAGIALGGPTTVASYDEEALATARVYQDIPLPAARWSLQRSTRDWLEAVQMAPSDLEMIHPHLGLIRLDEIVRLNAHDAVHHVWDIKRSLTH